MTGLQLVDQWQMDFDHPQGSTLGKHRVAQSTGLDFDTLAFT